VHSKRKEESNNDQVRQNRRDEICASAERHLNCWRKDGDVVVLLERKTSSASSLAEVYIHVA
jgi:hypothetical protein